MNKLTAQQWGRIIGCRCTLSNAESSFDGVKFEAVGLCLRAERLYNENGNEFPMEECKPILRTFDQMTEEEKEKHNLLVFTSNIQYEIGDSAYIVDYLDSIHVDQRGWIEAGLAIKEGEE